MTDNRSPLPPAGWHNDPNDPTSIRYWDGFRWTDHRAPKQPPAANRLPPAGWLNDPNDPLKLRWWDGSQWSGARQDKASSQPAQEQLQLHRAVSPVMRVVAENVSDKVASLRNTVGDVAGDVANGAANGAGCVFRLLKGIAMVVLFPLWLVLMLFGCGPLS